MAIVAERETIIGLDPNGETILGLPVDVLLTHQYENHDEMISRSEVLREQMRAVLGSLCSLISSVNVNTAMVENAVGTQLLNTILNYPAPIPIESEGKLKSEWIRLWLLDIKGFITFLNNRYDRKKRQAQWGTRFNQGAILTVTSALPPMKLLETRVEVESDIEVQVYSTAFPGVLYIQKTPGSVLDLESGKIYQLDHLMPFYQIDEDMLD